MLNRKYRHTVLFVLGETIFLVVICSSFISIIHYHFHYFPLTIFLMFLAVSHIANTLILSFLYSELSQIPLPTEVASTLESVKNNIQSLTDVADDHQAVLELLSHQLATLKGKE